STELDWSMEERADKTSKLQPKLENVLVATCSDDGTARLWYPMQANELACLTGHSDRVLSVSTSRAGQLCTSSLDSSLRIWKYNNQSQHIVPGHNGAVTFVCASAAGKVLSGSRDGTFRLWSKEAGSAVYICQVSLKASGKAVTCGCWLDDDTCVTGSDDCSISIWHINKDGRVVLKSSLMTESPLLSIESPKGPSNRVFFTAEWCGAVKAWNPDGQLARLQTNCGPSCMLLKMRYLSNMTLLVTTMLGYMHVINVQGLVEGSMKAGLLPLHTLTVPESEMEMNGEPDEQSQPAWLLDVTSDPANYITGDNKGQISYQVNNMRVATKVHAGDVTSVLETKNGVVFTGSKDSTIKIWEKTEEVLTQVGQFFCSAPVTSMCFLDNQSSTDIPIAYGDKLGYVNFLVWRG
ncbi:hypothetical protein DPMN_167866, partial [Dreissena polymorpha]